MTAAVDSGVRVARQPSVAGFRARLLEEVLSERGELIKQGTFTLAGAILALSVPEISRRALDQALVEQAPKMLMALAAAAVFVGVHRAWAGWLEDMAGLRLQARVEGQVLMRLMQAVLGSSYESLSKRSPGWTSETLSGASAAAHAFVAVLTTLLTQGLFAVVYAAALIAYSPLATVLVLAATAAIVALARLQLPGEQRAARDALQAQSQAQEQLHTLVASLSSLRALFCTNVLADKWDQQVGVAARAQAERQLAAAARDRISPVGSRLLSLCVTGWAAQRCLQGAMGVGELVLLATVATGMSSSVLALGDALIDLRALEPELDRVEELWQHAHRHAAPEPLAHGTTGEGIVVDNVSFRYSPEADWVLRGRSLVVAQGQLHRLDSPSGSGKSTLLRLIAGLLEPSDGRVRVFGIDPVLARASVLYVPQHATLFEASIADNLRLLSGASDEEILRVAALTGLDALLSRLPMGLETPVAAQGQNLSSGQRQLVVLTAAFASPRPVLLLDEATSQIDAGTRGQMDWPTLVAGRTVILVDHDRAL